MEKDQTVVIKWAIWIGRVPDWGTTRLYSHVGQIYFPAVSVLWLGYAAVWHQVIVPLFFPTPPLDENTRLGTCYDWKSSTWFSLWGWDPALCWQPWLKSEKALKPSVRLRVFRKLQEMNSHPRESPAKWKGEKEPQDTRADQSFSRMSPQVVKYRLIRGLIEAHHRLSDPTALARKLTVLREAHRTAVSQKAGPSHCCLIFFSRILTQAANYCQDLHERMFLEQLLLPNWISGSLCLPLF